MNGLLSAVSLKLNSLSQPDHRHGDGPLWPLGQLLSRLLGLWLGYRREWCATEPSILDAHKRLDCIMLGPQILNFAFMFPLELSNELLKFGSSSGDLPRKRLSTLL
jgi:hypothetical protein